MVKLSIAPDKEEISISLDLAGENGPIEISVGNYSIKEKQKKLYLALKDIQVSKEWMNILARKCFDQGKYEIPIPSSIKDILPILK